MVSWPMLHCFRRQRIVNVLKIIDVPSVQEAKNTLSAMFFSSGLTKNIPCRTSYGTNYAMEFFRESSTDNYDEENVEADFQTFSKVLTISWLTLSINFRLVILSVNSILICMKIVTKLQVVLGSYHNNQFSSTRFKISIRKWSMPPWSRDIIPYSETWDDDLSFCLASTARSLLMMLDIQTRQQQNNMHSSHLPPYTHVDFARVGFKENQVKMPQA